MPDREKVIKGLECCMSEQICRGCPYKEKDECEDGGYFYSKAIEDAIALLKEQEAVEPRVSTAEQRCGHCNKVIEMDGWQSCPWCGKMIDWKRWWNKNGTHDNT